MKTPGGELVTQDYLDNRLEALEGRITTTILKWMFAALLGQTAILAALVKLL